jgi:ABC-type nitrate/sulfonate/bicarbonate transport system substrate-binding protein
MLMAIDHSLADVILASPKIRNPSDLRGKRIGIAELNSFTEYFVTRSLESAGVPTASVKLFTVAPEDVPDAILKGEIDAGHTWDPALARGLEKGLRPILTSASALDSKTFSITDGIVFRTEVLQSGAIATGIVQAIFEAMEMQKSDPARFAAIAAQAFGISATDALRFIKEDIRYIDLSENVKIYSGPELHDEVLAIDKFFSERGMGHSETGSRGLIDDSIIRKIARDGTK